MSRLYRLVVVVVVIVAISTTVALLTAYRSGAEGPFAAIFERLGSAVASIEQSARERLSGPGRRGELAWFEQYRSTPARLKHPEAVLFGAYDSNLPGTLEGIRELEQALDTTFPLVQLYVAWGSEPDHLFPGSLATSIWNMGSIPVVTWEPWLSAFDNVGHPFLPLREARDLHGLASVARGDYDFYVDAWAREAASFGHPMFVRFAHEMNDPYRYPWGPQNNTKEEFIAAWRHVVERFRRAGAGNVIWVWSPHVAHEYWDLYYPGAEWADWVATGVLNFGPIAQWSRWWSFAEIFGVKYQRLAELGKPIMIAEFGSLSVGGDREAWYLDALNGLPDRYPSVRALLFFHAKADQTVTYQKVDWSFTTEPALSRKIGEALRQNARASRTTPP